MGTELITDLGQAIDKATWKERSASGEVGRSYGSLVLWIPISKTQPSWISPFRVPPKAVSHVSCELVGTSRRGAFKSSRCACGSRVCVFVHTHVHGDLDLPTCSSKFLDSAASQVQLKSIKTALAGPFVRGRGPATSEASLRAGGIQYCGQSPDWPTVLKSLHLI